MSDPVVVVREPWRAEPLAWIHRAEARAIARELGAPLAVLGGALPAGVALLRLSDPVMRAAVRDSATPYRGPGSAALELCYDKLEAHRRVVAAGIDAPETSLANASPPGAPFVLKPRRGSDSIGLRVAHSIPHARRNEDHLVQSRIVGDEVTVGVFRGEVGMPLRILLPPGTPYSFLRKYFWRPGGAPLDDARVCEIAQRVARILNVDWAARVDLIIEAGTGRICFLECDAAPLVGPDSAFAASFAAAGVDRERQLRWLVA
jgi:D-alanine-D-alanine ligase-like ATP-grasp enzyme